MKCPMLMLLLQQYWVQWPKPYGSLVMSQNGMTQNPSWDIKSLLGRIIQKEWKISDSENFALYSGWNFIGIRGQILFTLKMQIGRVSFVHCLKCNIFLMLLSKIQWFLYPSLILIYLIEYFLLRALWMANTNFSSYLGDAFCLFLKPICS